MHVVTEALPFQFMVPVAVHMGMESVMPDTATA